MEILWMVEERDRIIKPGRRGIDRTEQSVHTKAGKEVYCHID